MRLGYSCISKNLAVFSKQVMVAAGLLALPMQAKLEQSPLPMKSPVPVLPKKAKQPEKPDARVLRLKKFLSHLRCPATNLAEEFVHAADDNRLDWRLLPSISVVESGGGKDARNNNIFGWANGSHPFRTISEGIHQVAYQLSRGPLYRGRDLLGKLKVYNGDEKYAASVIEVMNRISPVADGYAARTVRPRMLALAEN
jgi:hypothetical protein